MPRPRRIHVPGGLYHAVLRGNHRQAIFGCGDGDYRYFEAILARALERYDASLLAYCWMSNHVHLAVQVADAPLGAVMGIVASRYARAKQRAVDTTGHLFERRYRARLVDSDRYLLALVRYIHLNPVRARMVSAPGGYRWSSHRAYLGDDCPGWLRTEPVLGRLGTAPDAAREAYRRFMSEAPEEPERDAVAVVARPGRRRVTTAGIPVPTGSAGAGGAPHRLDAIAADVASRLGLTMDDIVSKRRHALLVRARVEIARRALSAGVANLTQVARFVRRSPSTLSGLLHAEVCESMA
jgi:putative transposase